MADFRPRRTLIPPHLPGCTVNEISHLRVVKTRWWTDGKEVMDMELERSWLRVTIVVDWRLMVAIVLLILALLWR